MRSQRHHGRVDSRGTSGLRHRNATAPRGGGLDIAAGGLATHPHPPTCRAGISFTCRRQPGGAAHCGGQTSGLPAPSSGGAVEARRSRVARAPSRSDAEGALDLGGTVPQAAQRPRTHPRKRHKSLRKLVVSTFMTLDGVMQAPGGPEEDPTGGFTHGGWSVNYWDDVMGEAMAEAMSTSYDLLLGRKTYEIFAAHWPYVTDNPAADKLNSCVKHVASTTLDSVDWNNSTLLNGDVGQQIASLKEQNGHELQVQGSWQLIQTLLKHDLIDEYRFWIFPVVVGNGKRLFGEGTLPAGLMLRDAKTSTTGVVMATYERAGAVEIGSFALKEATDAEIARRQRLTDG